MSPLIGADPSAQDPDTGYPMILIKGAGGTASFAGKNEGGHGVGMDASQATTGGIYTYTNEDDYHIAGDGEEEVDGGDGDDTFAEDELSGPGDTIVAGRGSDIVNVTTSGAWGNPARPLTINVGNHDPGETDTLGIGGLNPDLTNVAFSGAEVLEFIGPHGRHLSSDLRTGRGPGQL